MLQFRVRVILEASKKRELLVETLQMRYAFFESKEAQ